MNMLRFCLSILFSLCLINAKAQKLNVESFAAKPNDLTARTQTRQDGNSVDCALVKVQLASSGATFSGNVVGDVKYNTSEYWVYMAQGSKRLTIRLEGYLPLEVNFEDYEIRSLESKTVYILIVSGITASPSIETSRIRTGWIIIDSEPTGASVFINDEFVGNTPLTNYKQAYGNYSYRVECPNYHSSSGTIELNSSKVEKTIELKPAFGSISITCSVVGARILLDGNATNKTTPCTLEKVPSGQHTITIQKEKYSPRQQSVIVEDEKTAQLSISLDARFAQVSITSLDGAEILCNGKRIATTKHVEDMMEGYYDIEARLAHHKTATKQIQVISGRSQEITIIPTPIYGSVDITSTPHEADITIDEIQYGKTPLTIEQLLEGEHQLVLSKNGYTTEERLFNIQENGEANIAVVLKEKSTPAFGSIAITSSVAGAHIFCNGKLMGWNSCVEDLVEGYYDIEVRLAHHKAATKRIQVLAGQSQKITLTPTPIYGSLDIKSTPHDADIIIDGKQYGKTPLAIEHLLEGEHQVILSKNGYFSDKRMIDIHENVKAHIVVELKEGISKIIYLKDGESLKTKIDAINTPLTQLKITGNIDLSDQDWGVLRGFVQRMEDYIAIDLHELIGLTGIKNGALSGCRRIKTINLPNSVRVIGNDAFSDCRYLTSINLPNSVRVIGSNAFSGCPELKSINIPNSVTVIGGRAFAGCGGLTSINIPDNIKKISNGTFCDCINITSITIPSSVTEIGNEAFRGCSNLASVDIPNFVNSIGDHAFEDCSGLSSISVASGNTKYDSRNNCNAIIETASNTLIGGCKNTIIPNSVSSIAGSAFSGSGLTTVTIPNSVTSIGHYAFNGCSALSSVSIPNSVTSIGKGIFAGCSALSSVSIPNSVTSTGEGTFINCSALSSVSIPNSVTSIGSLAFLGCHGLTSITIPNSVTTIGSGAFYDCSSLISLKIPDNVTTIGNEAFYGCIGLTSIDLSENITIIGIDAFNGCSSLLSVTLPNKVTRIERGTFYGCSGLTSITIPNSVKSIGSNAFAACSVLSSVSIPNSVTSIGEGAFSGCKNLTLAKIPNTTQINSSTFQDCPNINIQRE